MTETMYEIAFLKNIQVDKIFWLDGIIETINDRDFFDDYIIPIFDGENIMKVWKCSLKRLIM